MLLQPGELVAETSLFLPFLLEEGVQLLIFGLALLLPGFGSGQVFLCVCLDGIGGDAKLEGVDGLANTIFCLVDGTHHDSLGIPRQTILQYPRQLRVPEVNVLILLPQCSDDVGQSQ